MNQDSIDNFNYLIMKEFAHDNRVSFDSNYVCIWIILYIVQYAMIL